MPRTLYAVTSASGGDWSATATPLSFQDALLLLCARPQLRPAQVERLRALAAGADWPALVAAAEWHGVVPLLTQNLLAACPDAPPASVLSTLRARREYMARANRTLALELVRLQGVFKAEGIDLVTLKGPVLAASVFGNLALRDYGDLDLLVRPRDRARAQRLMLDLGYQPGDLQEQDILFFQRLALAHYHRIYRHPGTGVTVELHWRINPRFISPRIDSDGFWHRLERRRLLSTTVPDPAPEDLLLLLATHGSKHIWNRLRYVCDISACVERYPGLRWSVLLARARALHSERMLLVALELARRLLEVRLPAPIGAAIAADPAASALGEQLAVRLIARQDFDARFWALEMLPYWLRFKTCRRERLLVYPYLTYFLWLAFRRSPSDRDRALLRLPERFGALYFPLRVVRVGALGAALFARSVVRRVRGSRGAGIEGAA